MRLPEFNNDPESLEVFKYLNERYFNFTNQLPPFLKTLAMSESTYNGVSGDKPYGGINVNNPLITKTPWLFKDVFKGLDEKNFFKIAEAGMFIGLASVIFDHLVDNQFLNLGLVLLLHEAIFQKGASLLREMFPKNSHFWLQYERLKMEHINSLSKDIASQINPAGINFEEFEESTSGKVSPMLIAIAAMAQSVGEPYLLQPIESSQKYAIQAIQLNDDIKDWKKDLEQRHITYVLTEFIPIEKMRPNHWPEVAEVDKLLSSNWADTNIFDTVLEQINLALEAAADINCPAWKAYLKDYLDVSKQQQRAYVANYLKQAIKPLVGDSA